MSQNRTRAEQGYHYDGSAKMIHPDGQPSCRWCRGPVAKPRRTYCSDDCVHQWKLRTNPGYLRDQVFARDRGVCAECGVDTAANRIKVEAEVDQQLRQAGIHPRSAYGGMIREAALRGRGIQASQSVWQADHIIPVIEGGGECDLTNLRTMCIPCHQNATRVLLTRLALARRAEPLTL